MLGSVIMIWRLELAVALIAFSSCCLQLNLVLLVHAFEKDALGLPTISG